MRIRDQITRALKFLRKLRTRSNFMPRWPSISLLSRSMPNFKIAVPQFLKRISPRLSKYVLAKPTSNIVSSARPPYVFLGSIGYEVAVHHVFKLFSSRFYQKKVAKA